MLTAGANALSKWDPYLDDWTEGVKAVWIAMEQARTNGNGADVNVDLKVNRQIEGAPV